ncbi:MAG: hypothetical protein L3J39_00050 [Verrucomicrobiales bacterium]|nr:hypothetical protein [Verrucomicrobiales bacterium]
MSSKLLYILPLLSLALNGCDSASRPIVITEKRELSEKERQLALDATSKERFSMVRQMMGMPGEEDHSGHNHAEGEHNHDRAESAPLAYQLPDGWKKEATTQFRSLNFSFGKESEGQCYVSRVGGGLVANLNRWRGQMGLKPISAEEIEKLPKRLLFGMESTYVELDGSFKGMGSPEAKPDYRMVGLVLSMPDVSFFVKMTGPKALLIEHEKNFAQFCESLKLVKGGSNE